MFTNWLKNKVHFEIDWKLNNFYYYFINEIKIYPLIDGRIYYNIHFSGYYRIWDIMKEYSLFQEYDHKICLSSDLYKKII
jgi:hypothetical protein